MAKSYLNTQFGKPLFGKQQGYAPTARAGANPRAGMSYSMGLDRHGNVVHIYRDGERIVMHTHAPTATPPHPASFGGTQAPTRTPADIQAAQAAHVSPTSSEHPLPPPPHEGVDPYQHPYVQTALPVHPNDTIDVTDHQSHPHEMPVPVQHLVLQHALATLAQHGA